MQRDLVDTKVKVESRHHVRSRSNDANNYLFIFQPFPTAESNVNFWTLCLKRNLAFRKIIERFSPLLVPTQCTPPVMS